MTNSTIAIGEMSRRTGCNIETIRYYERIGILPKAPRRGRYRIYGPDDIVRLSFVRRARELGFPLEEIRALLGIATSGQVSCAEARSIAALHLASVRARLADLRKMERVLASTVRACDTDDHPGCPLLDALSASN